MARVLYPNEGALYEMNLIASDLALCVVNLFQNQISIDPSTKKADLVVADFDGYAPKTVTALLPAYLDPIGGASAQIATIQFDHTGGGTSNTIYGAWVETAAGDLVLLIQFDAGIPMTGIGDSLPLDVKFNFGN